MGVKLRKYRIFDLTLRNWSKKNKTKQNKLEPPLVLKLFTPSPSPESFYSIKTIKKWPEKKEKEKKKSKENKPYYWP